MQTIKYSVDTDGIALITIDVKNRSMNVITPEFLADLSSAVELVATAPGVKGGVITSGKDTFLAGADLIDLVETFEERTNAAEVYETHSSLQKTLRRLETCGKPVAVAINGTALGGGLEICLACHYRVVANKPKAVFGLPEVKIGLLPGAGGTQRLPRLIGIERALPLITQGTHLNAAAAVDAGFIDDIVASGTEVSAAKKWVLESGECIAPWDSKGFKVPGGVGLANPSVAQVLALGTAQVQRATKHNYPAPIAIMSAIYEGTVLPIDKALEIESKYFVSLLMDPVSRNMMRTLFVNKNAADKLAARPKEPATQAASRVGILGAGMMGAGIAFVSAKASVNVVLLDTSEENAELGKDYSRDLAAQSVAKGQMTSEQAEKLIGRIQTTTDYEDFRGCELLIEAVFEDRSLKADVTTRAEAMIDGDVVFASNTSTLPITGLADASCRPESFIGLHFFSPVDKMPLVEIIVGSKTNDNTVARALDFVQQLRKTPIVVNDSRGFYTSRVFGVFTREGAIMLAEGINPALIENVARSAGMPVGPLAVTDEVSIELNHHVVTQSRNDMGDEYIASAADAVFEKFVEELDRKGKKAGKGYYEYPESGKKYLWPGLQEHYPLLDEQPDADTVRNRLLYVQAIETVRCLDEGVLTTPEDADIGAVYGWGFPAYTGGPISFIDTVGPKTFIEQADRLAAAYGERFSVPDSLREMAATGETFYTRTAAGQRKSAA